MNKKDILEAYQSMILLPVMHEKVLKDFLQFNEPLVTLTKEILKLIDERLGLANYGIDTEEKEESLIGTKCYATIFGDGLDEDYLIRSLKRNDKEEMDSIFIIFYDDTITQCIVDRLTEPFYSDEDYSWDSFADVARYLYVYVENGGDIDKLVKDVTRKFLKKRK